MSGSWDRLETFLQQRSHNAQAVTVVALNGAVPLETLTIHTTSRSCPKEIRDRLAGASTARVEVIEDGMLEPTRVFRPVLLSPSLICRLL